MNPLLKRTLLPIFLAASLSCGAQSRVQKAPSIDTLVTKDTLYKPNDAAIKKYIDYIYKHIKFPKGRAVSLKVFSTAMKGYLNLDAKGFLSTTKNIISICDFNQPSDKFRLWVIDLAKKKVLFNTYVAHGQGSGETFARSFSNKEDSHKSSLGFYVTGGTYVGEHGTSLYLNGLDTGFNHAAMDRKIVLHGADYVSGSFIAQNELGFLGRSWGCPAVPSKLSGSIIDAVKDSTCLFIAYEDKKYLSKSQWLKGKPVFDKDSLPAEIKVAIEQKSAAAKKPRPKHKKHIKK